VVHGIPVNILAFIPAVILGVIGGFMGALFTFMNLKVARLRKRLLAGLNAKWKQNTARMVEPVIIIVRAQLILGKFSYQLYFSFKAYFVCHISVSPFNIPLFTIFMYEE
jgi:hypothetical protein